MALGMLPNASGNPPRNVIQEREDQYTKVKESKNITTPVSVKKVRDVKKRKPNRNQGYRLFDIQIFEDIVSSLACPECLEKNCVLRKMV